MPKSAKVMNDPSLLEAALEGLQLKKQRLEVQIQEVKTLLGQRAATTTAEPGIDPEPRKRQLSEGARRRIAAAQKKRWAEYRKTAVQNKARTE